MRYLLLVLFLASLAGLEFFHVRSSDDATGAMLCVAPEGKADVIRDLLLGHRH